MAINVLDRHTAELIAAGEVVERPASVVKELAENAIDAGATAVTVEIAGGGIALIRVADNGCGIERADLPLAFVRHATSKVRSEADLEAIATLGFRGEALASIGSVAKVSLLSKSEREEDAAECLMTGGEVGEVQAAARGQGTTIEVRELFYNTPARMKFLKKDASEAAYVTEVMGQLALSHTDVAFRYMRDGKAVFVTAGDGDLHAAAWQVLGKEFARGLLPVCEADGLYKVEGLVTAPGAGRASRSMQFFFVNGRTVKNRTMMAALEQAYRGLAMQGRFPGGILFLQMPPELVDVNIHPAKTEVRFAKEQEVFGATYRAVKAALMAGIDDHRHLQLGTTDGLPAREAGTDTAAQATIPDTAFYAGEPGTSGFAAVGSGPVTGLDAPYPATPADVMQPGAMASPPTAIVYQTRLAQPPGAGQNTPQNAGTGEWGLDIWPDETEASESPAAFGGEINVPQQPLAEAQFASQQPEDAAPPEPLRLVGEAFMTYILAEAGDTLCLIDKHAAHERLLYEKLAAARGAPDVQLLLAPVAVNLSAAEKDALLQNEESLAAAGIEAEDFGGGAVLVRGVPADVETNDVAGLVTEVAHRLSLNSRDALNEKTEWVLHSIACRAAVKAGDRTPPAALLRLAQDILNGTVPPFCPHGRPVVLEITRKELEKQFGRLG